MAAVLLAASAVQGCANNPLALIDGPFVPASERVAAARQQQAEVPPVIAPPVANQPVAAPLAEQVPPEDLAYPDAAFVGPVLTAPEMAQLAAPDEMPETPEAAPEAAPVELAAIDPAAERDQRETIGPDFLPPEAPVELATRLPSAFDFAPQVPPRGAAPEVSGMVAFHRFAVARLTGPTPREGRMSMLLADPPSLDPALLRCANRSPAVLLDLDPANALAPLVEGGSTPASVELGSYLSDLRQRGVTVYWITGHGPEAASALRRRLAASGLDSAGRDPLIVSRFFGESKQARRQALGETHCVLAIAGDQRGDFDELYDFLRDPAFAEPLEQHVGNGWFLVPPPLD